MANEQRNRKFGVDPKTGELMLGTWRIPLPRSRIGRIILGSVLIVAGILGFLPILGFWMLPLGFLVISQELPVARRMRRRIALWWARRRQRKADRQADGKS